MSYQDFLSSKAIADAPSGFKFEYLTNGGTHNLFPFQKAIVQWAIRRGRAAIFADTGLGKSFMQASWAWAVHQYSGNRVLIFAPLCVAQQTVEEAAKLGVPIRYVREQPKETGIFITNYEMLHHFDLSSGWFDGVALDESSIIKHQDSKTRNRLIEACRKVPYRLSCTATPSPNDYMELGNQAEFLGVMGMTEMLAMFFTHDSGETSKWRLKGHARSKFWEWLSHWAVVIKKPSDLGFSDEGYLLPDLNLFEHKVAHGETVAQKLSERNTARRESTESRVTRCAELVNAMDGQAIVWCHLNNESQLLSSAIDGAIEVTGSLSTEEKERRIMAFTHGDARVLVTKPSIAGFGMNWQHCNKMAFVGLNDSYEELYQAIRRCYRFGQTKPVEVHLVSATSEGAVLDNIKRKEALASQMSDEMIAHMRDFCRREITPLERQQATYTRKSAKDGRFTLYLGDCIDVARDLPEGAVDYSIFSPPFSSLYTYSNSERDMGNSRNDAEFFQHFDHLIAELYRVLRPGRNISVHLMNLPSSKQNHGYIGIRDFRGEVIRAFQKHQFIYHSEVCVWKDPVVAMQRTKALGLLWKQIKKDSAMSRQGIPDYVVTFRKPGVNTRPLTHAPEQFPVALWQQLASPCWTDIKQSNTLNRKLAREKNDERHICPLQLDLIERCLFLWSNPDDIVFSPFTGIGSEGLVALRMGRKFVGAELKESYFKVATENLHAVNQYGYTFPEFNKSIGGWSPGGAVQEEVITVTPDIDTDTRQMNLF